MKHLLVHVKMYFSVRYNLCKCKSRKNRSRKQLQNSKRLIFYLNNTNLSNIHMTQIPELQLNPTSHRNYILPDPELPLEIKKPLEDIRCMENETVTFTVELNKPDVPFKFLKEGEEVKPKDGYEVKCVGTTYTLTVLKTKVDQQADYTFTAGDLTSTGKLIVDGKA